MFSSCQVGEVWGAGGYPGCSMLQLRTAPQPVTGSIQAEELFSDTPKYTVNSY